MFKINFRIVDELDELKIVEISNFDCEWQHIYGFFQVCFGGHKEGGFYHERILEMDEMGDELLDYWFGQFLNVLFLLNTKTDYVAFKEIEKNQKWLSFKKTNKDVMINVAIDKMNTLKPLLLLEEPDVFKYIEPVNYTLDFNELKKEIVINTQIFLQELKSINENLINTKMAIGLKKKLKKFYEILKIS